MVCYFAIPKNTARQRSTSSRVSAPMRPKTGPSLSRLTVMALSTMTCEGLRRPFSALGCTGTRSSGAAAGVLVMGRMVTLACSLNGSA